MTDYGLEVRNNNNIVIIDSTYRNHTYHAHGTSFVQQYLTEIDIPDVETSAVLFLKAPSFYVFPYGFERNGSVYDKIVIASDSTGYVDWIVYKEFNEVSNEDYGLNVFDSSAQLVFSSNTPGYLKVVDERAYTSIGANLLVGNADDNYFTFTGSNIGYNFDLTASPTTLERRMRGFKKVDSTTLATAMFIYYYSEGELPSGGGASGGSSTVTPQWFIEIQPPPSI